MTARKRDIELTTRLTAYVTREEGQRNCVFRRPLRMISSGAVSFLSHFDSEPRCVGAGRRDKAISKGDLSSSGDEPFFREPMNGPAQKRGVMLPPDVQAVTKPSGKVYYYYAPGRGTKSAGVRVPLGSDSSDPEFWRRLRDARNSRSESDGTLSALFAAYKARETIHGPAPGVASRVHSLFERARSESRRPPRLRHDFDATSIR